ncbi:MAG TPA: multiheme c-type cytochrome, partial [Verrucomicrobiae bacterium]|nr:multiheme c-type cytochrome [Verrucomicrobiae bacterium]
MPRKSISASHAPTKRRVFAALAVLQLLLPIVAAETNSEARPKFLGANACASSGCHGGAGAHQNQYLIWTSRDFHHQRPFATLTTARSKQISAALQIKDATTDHQCISCHAPLREIPEPLRAERLRITEGVSCETCHGPSENWLRSHTRADYTHTDRVLSGMRDLKNLYVRANTCVACHQTVPLPLLHAGHPELIFELDGQSVTEPKHWREKTNWHNAQAWAVGQSVALREMLWQLETAGKPDAKLLARTEALLWLFERLQAGGNSLPKSALSSGQSDASKLKEARAAADILARDLAEFTWSNETTGAILKTLAS